MASYKITKTKLLSIREIKIPEDILGNETRLFRYTRGPMLTFIEYFPRYEEQIKATLEAKDYDALSKCLREVCDQLKLIFAVDMAYDCQKKMAKLPDIKQEVIETYVAYFLTAISMLSIDLQMAVFNKKEDNEEEEKFDDDVAEKKVDKKEDEKAESKKRRILAVDDVPFFLKTLERALQESNYELVAVTSGQVALRYLQNSRPDLFILDIEMPEMNGYELAKNIREAGHTAPILFLTSNAQQECVLRAIEAGAADFVLKPINGEYLLARIEKHIQ